VGLYNEQRAEEVLRITAACMGVEPFERVRVF
jgi:hypothetical protein